MVSIKYAESAWCCKMVTSFRVSGNIVFGGGEEVGLAINLLRSSFQDLLFTLLSVRLSTTK